MTVPSTVQLLCVVCPCLIQNSGKLRGKAKGGNTPNEYIRVVFAVDASVANGTFRARHTAKENEYNTGLGAVNGVTRLQEQYKELERLPRDGNRREISHYGPLIRGF